MVVLPPFTPVTSPVFDTVPFAGVPETHALLAAAVPVPVSCRVPPAHKVFPPLMFGDGLTFTVTCVVVAHCPALGVKVYVVV